MHRWFLPKKEIINKRYYQQLSFLEDKRYESNHGDDLMAREERKKKVHNIYNKYYQGLERNSTEYNKLAKNATAFLSKYPLFSKSDDDFINNNKKRLQALRRLKDEVKLPSLLEDRNQQFEPIYQSSVFEGNMLRQSESRIIFQNLCNGAITVSDCVFNISQDKANIIKDYTEISEEKRDHIIDLRNHYQVLQYGLKIGFRNFDEKSLKQAHNMLFHETLQEKRRSVLYRIYAGDYRQLESRPANYATVYPYPLEIPYLMQEFFTWKNNLWDNIDHDNVVIYSCQVLYKFLHIHPFPDGNGRLGRLLFLLALQSHGYPPVVFYKSHGVDRKKYLDALAAAQENNKPEILYDMVLTVLEDRLTKSLKKLY